jgi:hypothetical protein
VSLLRENYASRGIFISSVFLLSNKKCCHLLFKNALKNLINKSLPGADDYMSNNRAIMITLRAGSNAMLIENGFLSRFLLFSSINICKLQLNSAGISFKTSMLPLKIYY